MEQVKSDMGSTSPDVAMAQTDAEFAAFFADELQLFFQHLHRAAVEFNKHKTLPQSVFQGKLGSCR